MTTTLLGNYNRIWIVAGPGDRHDVIAARLSVAGVRCFTFVELFDSEYPGREFLREGWREESPHYAAFANARARVLEKMEKLCDRGAVIVAYEPNLHPDGLTNLLDWQDDLAYLKDLQDANEYGRKDTVLAMLDWRKKALERNWQTRLLRLTDHALYGPIMTRNVEDADPIEPEEA